VEEAGDFLELLLVEAEGGNHENVAIVEIGQIDPSRFAPQLCLQSLKALASIGNGLFLNRDPILHGVRSAPTRGSPAIVIALASGFSAIARFPLQFVTEARSLAAQPPEHSSASEAAGWDDD